MDNMGRPPGESGCFCCFHSNLSAIDISSFAEFLGGRSFGDLKNSQMTAVRSLFFAFFFGSSRP